MDFLSFEGFMNRVSGKLARIGFDIFMYQIAMVAAIVSHNLTFSFRDFGQEFTAHFYFERVVRHLIQWGDYALLCSAAAFVVFYFCGFYHSERFIRSDFNI